MLRCTFRATFVLLALLFVTAPIGSAQTAAPPPSADDAQTDELLARALTQHKAGDLLGALTGDRDLALQAAPKRADIRSNLGAAYVGLGRFADAITEYQKALADRDDAAIRLNLGLALYKAARLEEAVPELQKVLAADAGNTQAALVLADCLLQQGHDQEVVDLLTPRESAFPDDLAYAYLLGTALLRTGETQKGEVLVDRIFRKGESAEGHLLMGLAYVNKRDYTNALKELERAVALNPALPNVQLLYGRALLGSGDRDKAMRVFRTAVEQQPDSFDALLQIGTLYRLDQKYEQALVYLTRAAAVRPDNVPVRHGLASTYRASGEPDKALALLEGVVRDAPSFVDGHVLLATTYYRLKRKEDGDRERVVIARLNAENQAKQPGAKRSEELEHPEPSADAAPPAAPRN